MNPNLPEKVINPMPHASQLQPLSRAAHVSVWHYPTSLTIEDVLRRGHFNNAQRIIQRFDRIYVASNIADVPLHFTVIVDASTSQGVRVHLASIEGLGESVAMPARASLQWDMKADDFAMPSSDKAWTELAELTRRAGMRDLCSKIAEAAGGNRHEKENAWTAWKRQPITIRQGLGEQYRTEALDRESENAA
ncbi:MAG: hypothetical protein CMM81_20025 [Rhodospirillales bacterium]|nr:hypothetical protein [Rhodospirillales bacterium]|tara:strand:+ start:30211 stop:30786 length:576 start_codon:yes stop_codon:yes gene_type:complete